MQTSGRVVSIICAAALLAGCTCIQPKSVTSKDMGIPTGFIDMTTTVDGKEQPCVLYVPRDYDPDRAWPLIVFLHGAGERGDGGLHQIAVGIGPAIQEFPERFPCLVLMPQCPWEYVWGVPKTWDQTLKDALPSVDEALEQVLEHYNIDHKRISLTGLSMGGYGTFQYGAQRIDTFSALMPICGGGNPDDAETLAKVPMQVFHGADDSVVPPERSREMVRTIRAAGGDIEYTEFPDTDHWSWDKVYGENVYIEWLLKQRRN